MSRDHGWRRRKHAATTKGNLSRVRRRRDCIRLVLQAIVACNTSRQDEPVLSAPPLAFATSRSASISLRAGNRPLFFSGNELLENAVARQPGNDLAGVPTVPRHPDLFIHYSEISFTNSNASCYIVRKGRLARSMGILTQPPAILWRSGKGPRNNKSNCN